MGIGSAERNPRHCPLFIVFSSFIGAVVRFNLGPVFHGSVEKEQTDGRARQMKSSRRISMRSKNPPFISPRDVSSDDKGRRHIREIPIANQIKNFHYLRKVGRPSRKNAACSPVECSKVTRQNGRVLYFLRCLYPEELRIVVFRRGMSKGSKGLIPRGGQNSTEGEKQNESKLQNMGE